MWVYLNNGITVNDGIVVDIYSWPNVFLLVNPQSNISSWVFIYGGDLACFCYNNIVKNTYCTNGVEYKQYYYTLTFSYAFKYESDKVYFAYSRPYTLGRHFGFIKSIKEKLVNEAVNVSILNCGKLQEQIKQFINDTETEGKKPIGEEDKFKLRQQRYATKGTKATDETNLVALNILRKFNDVNK